MTETKENILQVALKLFSKAGYEAVSVRDIASVLKITQSALYKHYASKQAIFDAILRRMEENDSKRAIEFDVPRNAYSGSPEEYQNCAIASLKKFTIDMFHYWTEDEFASSFRRMLVIEQYRTPEMNARYQQYLGAGVVKFLSDIFREHGDSHADDTAIRFYGPFYLLLSQYDSVSNPQKLIHQLENHLKGFPL